MERNLTVKTNSPREWSDEECITPTDPGSRIPPASVCPPAPRKRPSSAAHYNSDELDRNSKMSRHGFSKVSIRILFDVPQQDDSSMINEIAKMKVNDRRETDQDRLDKESHTNDD